MCFVMPFPFLFFSESFFFPSCMPQMVCPRTLFTVAEDLSEEISAPPWLHPFFSFSFLFQTPDPGNEEISPFNSGNRRRRSAGPFPQRWSPSPFATGQLPRFSFARKCFIACTTQAFRFSLWRHSSPTGSPARFVPLYTA